MNATTYIVWNKMKSLASHGIYVYHCADLNEIRSINELKNAGFITVSWKTFLDAVFHIAGETE